MPYKDKEECRTKASEYYWNHREQRSEYQKEHRKKNPNARRNSSYKYVFGVELEAILLKLRGQGNGCAICSKVLDINSETRSTKPYLDHDHSNGMIRDILCARCNAILGNVGDSIELLLKFITYIQRHKENPSRDVAACWKRLNGSLLK